MTVRHRRLGRSGLEVSSLCLGAMMFGDRADEAESERIVHLAREAGVNFIDTADAYAGGRSEEIVGKAVRSHRDWWVVATKVGTRLPPAAPNRGGIGRSWLLRGADESLARLKIGHIDVYYLHLDDLETPLEETVDALGQLIRQGKIRHWGVSNFRAWRIAEFIRLCDLAGVPRPVVGQPYYNAVNRMPEVEYLPLCAHHGVGVVPYSPLARGVLSGKYAEGAAPPDGSRVARGDPRILQTEWRPESLAIARAVARHAAERGMTTVAFAIAWVLKNAFVSAAIAGPRTEAQWDSYLAALAAELGPEDEAFVDGLVAPGHASTPGYTDPAYPVEGRRVR